MISISSKWFSGRDEAVALVKASGLFVSEAELSQAELSGAPHAHPYDVAIYLIEGVLELQDCEARHTYRLEPGSRALVPGGTRHAESCEAPFHAVFGVSIDPVPLMAERRAALQ